jgi:hypothetical protein
MSHSFVELSAASMMGLSYQDRFPNAPLAPTFLHGSSTSFRPVLHLAFAEGPILTPRINEIDPHIFHSHPSLLMDLVGDLMEEFPS